MSYQVGGYDLKEIQNVMLEMMADIDRVCEKNGIRYILDGGTMLGAVRHKGFIPWDDDLDIAMLRDDYIKFSKIANSELDKKYKFECIENNREYPYNFGKVFCLNTKYTEEFTRNLNICHGVYIDVFPMDYVDSSKPKKLHLIHRLTSMLTQLRYAKLKLIHNVKYQPFKILPLKLINFLTDKLMRYSYRKKGEHIQKLCHYGPNKPYVSKTLFTDTVKVPYETYHFSIPSEYDSFLTGRYGDYMKLPPVEKQKPVHNILEIEI